MIIVTSISPTHVNKENQHTAIDSWRKLGADIYSLHSEKEIEKIEEENYEVSLIKTHRIVDSFTGTKPLVSINAMIDFAKEKEDDLLIINSDIVLKDFPELRDDGITIFSRNDYEFSIEQSQTFESGFDAFYIPKKFLDIFPITIFGLGNCWYDLGLPLTAIDKSVRVYHPQAKIAFHKIHNIQWDINEWIYHAEFFRWNFFRFEKSLNEGQVATMAMQKIRSNLIPV